MRYGRPASAGRRLTAARRTPVSASLGGDVLGGHVCGGGLVLARDGLEPGDAVGELPAALLERAELDLIGRRQPVFSPQQIPYGPAH